jgi:hypothetical protein
MIQDFLSSAISIVTIIVIEVLKRFYYPKIRGRGGAGTYFFIST